MPDSRHNMRRALLAALLTLSVPGYAETVYVIDRVVVGVRAEPVEGAAVVKSVETGAALEVLDRQDTMVQVREPQGTEGWIDARYLSAQPPARSQVQTLQTELARLRAQLAKAQAQPAEPQAAATQKLEVELNTVRAQLVQAQTQLKDARRDPAPVSAAPAASGGGFKIIWVVVVFAMLGIGFVAGVIWVRESIRRRMGGMYLRI